ncbi:MAG: hypothetical protein ACPG6V_01900 [Flavobacteriales bacterium]
MKYFHLLTLLVMSFCFGINVEAQNQSTKQNFLLLSLENSGKPTVSNKTGDYHLELGQSKTIGLSINFQREISKKFNYSWGIKNTYQFDAIFNLDRTFGTETDLTSASLEFPVFVYYNVLNNRNLIINTKLGVKPWLKLFGSHTGVVYGTGLPNTEEWGYYLDFEDGQDVFDVMPSTGVQMQIFNRFIVDLELTYKLRELSETKYEATHKLNSVIVKQGAGVVTSKPLLFGFSLGYILNK